MQMLVLLLCPLLVLHTEAMDWSNIKNLDLKINDGGTTRNKRKYKMKVISMCKMRRNKVMVNNTLKEATNTELRNYFDVVVIVSAEGRIINGTQAERHQFPYQVGVIVDDTYLCGGSLITNSVVLTAAHCTYKYSDFVVHLAAQNIMDEGEPDRQIVTASHAVTHEAWDPDLLHNDIALVFLPTSVAGVGIELIRLPSHSQENLTFLGEMARISGWGKVSDEQIFPNPNLTYADVMIAANESDCTIYGNRFVDSTMVCVDPEFSTGNICNGDSGSPLVYYETDSLPTQIGLVSYGNVDGCESPKPVVFTQVSAYLDWLEINAGVVIQP